MLLKHVVLSRTAYQPYGIDRHHALYGSLILLGLGSLLVLRPHNARTQISSCIPIGTMGEYALRAVPLHDEAVDHVLVGLLGVGQLLDDVLADVVDPFRNHLFVVGLAEQELVDRVLDGFLELLLGEDQLVGVLFHHPPI
jgi:hypothetical protein